ncbi:MAG TPA: ParB/RepB/Spo0J family partition protein [Hyphomicrobiales bacterium]|nr:ParB/RepB/Spo0J family partition protein [Hyphomicrobiales bacterium]
MADERSRGLGRGLAALLGDVGVEERTAPRKPAPRGLAIDQIRPNPNNPRRNFSEAALDELAASVREKGVVQPILVRATGDGYEIIAGERRWRAAQRAGLHDVPVVVLEVSEREALELAIIENVQRSDLNAIEEAAGYQVLIASHGYSPTDLAKTIGKSRSHIANTLRLLKLPEEVRAAVEDGRLSAGHARALIGLDDAGEVARRVIAHGLSVRETEALVQRLQTPPETKSMPMRPASDVGDPNVRSFERELSEALGLAVSVAHKGPGGTLSIRYRDLDQLDALKALLTAGRRGR